MEEKLGGRQTQAVDHSRGARPSCTPGRFLTICQNFPLPLLFTVFPRLILELLSLGLPSSFSSCFGSLFLLFFVFARVCVWVGLCVALLFSVHLRSSFSFSHLSCHHLCFDKPLVGEPTVCSTSSTSVCNMTSGTLMRSIAPTACPIPL